MSDHPSPPPQSPPRPVDALPVPKTWLHSPRDAIALGVCAKCGKPPVFTDDLSRAEYRISGLCSPCWDGIFAESYLGGNTEPPTDFADTGDR